ncbi:MAG: 16S rRNA (uracil(1498)-N(3))-methyltransferase [Acidobacteriales bacterium]|nr:16S rRNA (uracil(1498)-N(3))-methyltransferase [Terriglobales bacterium]
MTRRRWIADEVSGGRALLLDKNAHHLARVLRAKIGQQFDVVADGRVRRARIASISDQRVEFDLAEELPTFDLPVEITLLLSVFRFEPMEWALEKATEMGVARFVPIIAQRSEKHLVSAAGKRVERWQRIAHEASQQARRASVPEVSTPMKIDDAITAGEGIVLAESEENKSLKNALAEIGSRSALRLAIGPEGGWTNDELELFREAQWRTASLGKTILRAETAAVAALAVAIAELT